MCYMLRAYTTGDQNLRMTSEQRHLLQRLDEELGGEDNDGTCYKTGFDLTIAILQQYIPTDVFGSPLVQFLAVRLRTNGRDM